MSGGLSGGLMKGILACLPGWQDINRSRHMLTQAEFDQWCKSNSVPTDAEVKARCEAIGHQWEDCGHDPDEDGHTQWCVECEETR